MYIHTVFFKFKSPKDAPEAKKRLTEMRGQVPSLLSIEVGIDQLHGNRSWDMVLNTSFKNQSGYEEYAKDPTHQRVLRWLKTVIAQSATVDYEKEG